MATEDKLAESRKKFFDGSAFNPSNQKYGLFSFTGTLAVSKEPYFTVTPSHKDAEGKVATGPHNFLVPAPKSGKTNDAYFGTFEYQVDRYNDPIRSTKSEKERTEKLKKFHDNVWKPAAYVEEPVSLFPHEACDKHVKINRRTSEGGVRIDPKNFLTSPAKKGNAAVTPGVLLGPIPEHMVDEFDRKMKTARDASKISRAKRHGGAFKSMDFGNKTFNDDKSIYGGDVPAKPVKRPKTMSVANHDRPFYPANPTKKDSTIGPYPEHIADPLPPKVKKAPSEAVPWKVTTVGKSKPSPSVTTHIKNIRSDFPTLRNMF